MVEIVVERFREVVMVEVVEVVGVVKVHQRLGHLPRPLLPPTTEAAMAARMEQRLATKASLQHRSHSRGEASTFYEVDYLSYMANVAQIEASVVVTRGVTQALEPCGATMELDPHKGEVGRQARFPQSFLLSEVIRTPSMVPTPPIELTVGPAASTSRVVDTDVSSSVVS
jgi:hypothetical protein